MQSEAPEPARAQHVPHRRGGGGQGYLFDGLALGDLRVSDHLVRGADLDEGELGVLRDLGSQSRLPAAGRTWGGGGDAANHPGCSAQLPTAPPLNHEIATTAAAGLR